MAVVDINAGTAEQVAKELAEKGIRAISLAADVTLAKDCQRCACQYLMILSCAFA